MRVPTLPDGSKPSATIRSCSFRRLVPPRRPPISSWAKPRSGGRKGDPLREAKGRGAQGVHTAASPRSPHPEIPGTVSACYRKPISDRIVAIPQIRRSPQVWAVRTIRRFHNIRILWNKRIMDFCVASRDEPGIMDGVIDESDSPCAKASDRPSASKAPPRDVAQPVFSVPVVPHGGVIAMLPVRHFSLVDRSPVPPATMSSRFMHSRFLLLLQCRTTIRNSQMMMVGKNSKGNALRVSNMYWLILRFGGLA